MQDGLIIRKKTIETSILDRLDQFRVICSLKSQKSYDNCIKRGLVHGHCSRC